MAKRKAKTKDKPAMENNIVLSKLGKNKLPDNEQWINRHEIKSETSDRIYVVSQHKTKRHWGCSCPGWRTRRHCKHLMAIGLPGHEEPYELNQMK